MLILPKLVKVAPRNKKQMVKKINLIIQNNIKYAEIILDDWKEAV